MTTKKTMPWDTAQSLYGRMLEVRSPQNLDKAALDWNGESEDFPGEPAAGDYHLHHLLFLNIQAQGEIAARLDDLTNTLQREGQSNRKGIRLMLERLDALRSSLPDEDDDEEDDEDDEVEAPPPPAASTPPSRRGPRLVGRPSDYPHPVPAEDTADAS